MLTVRRIIREHILGIPYEPIHTADETKEKNKIYYSFSSMWYIDGKRNSSQDRDK